MHGRHKYDLLLLSLEVSPQVSYKTGTRSSAELPAILSRCVKICKSEKHLHQVLKPCWRIIASMLSFLSLSSGLSLTDLVLYTCQWYCPGTFKMSTWQYAQVNLLIEEADAERDPASTPRFGRFISLALAWIEDGAADIAERSETSQRKGQQLAT